MLQGISSPRLLQCRVIAILVAIGIAIGFGRQLRLLHALAPSQREQQLPVDPSNEFHPIGQASLQGTSNVNDQIGLKNSSDNQSCSFVTVHKEATIKAPSLFKKENRDMLHGEQRATKATTIEPIWVPSYPGSGSELFRTLILTLTGGVDGANHYDRPHRCSRYPATCKTHCPFLQRQLCPTRLGLEDPRKPNKATTLVDKYYHQSAMLLLRNPINAMPSYINWQHESRDENLSTHTTQAPESTWKKRRDESFERLFGGWINHLTWWTTNERQSAYNVSLIIPYEHLTSEQHGPLLLKQVAVQLQKAKIPVVASTIPSDEASLDSTVTTFAKDTSKTNVTPMDRWFQCLWLNVVKAPKSTTKRAAHKYIPSYTAQQKADMITRLDRLIGNLTVSTSMDTSTFYQTTHTLRNILVEYRHEIATNIRLDDE